MEYCNQSLQDFVNLWASSQKLKLRQDFIQIQKEHQSGDQRANIEYTMTP